MNCYECAKANSSVPAVALCPNCSAGLCLSHLHQAAAYHDGATWLRCPHGAGQLAKT